MNPNIFRMYDIRGKAREDFPDEIVKVLGLSIGTYFADNGETQAVVARDNRLHSLRLRNALLEGLTRAGIDVLDVGETLTPIFYFCHHLYEKKAGVMITGSHNPPEDNGFKIYSGHGTIYGDDILEIKDIANHGVFRQGRGDVTNAFPEDTYFDYISSKVHLARTLKVAVDAGNGTAGPRAVRLLSALGCEVIPLYCDPDPTFPHHHPDPTVQANLQDLITTVRTQKADVGVGFDGDGDRLGIVNDKGEIVWGDVLQVLFWREILPHHPGAAAIVEVKCSQVLFDEIERLGGKPFFHKTGHSLIKKTMRDIGSPFTGEMSGHFFFADEYFGYDDALYATARLLRILAREESPLSELLSDLPRVCSTPETRIDCADDRKFEVVRSLTERFRGEGYSINDVDGVRINFGSGWGLIRASNTQPALVARCEARTLGQLRAIAGLLKSHLRESGVGDFEWEIPK